MLMNSVDASILVTKYLILAILSSLILIGGSIVDKRRILGRILRVIGYIGIILFVVIDALYMHILNSISYPFLLLLSLICVSITIYTEGYSRVLFGMARVLQVPVEILSVSMLMLFSSTLLIEFVMFWIITELIGFMIILFNGTHESWRAAITYLVVGALTADISLFTVLAVLAQNIGLENIFSLSIKNIMLLQSSVNPLLSILILLGFIAKAALVPFHFWLPDAYTVAPTPASALFSGVMEKMSVFGILIIFYMINVDYILTGTILIILGLLTSIYAGLQAILQSDAKRLLSYSTMGYSGCIMGFVGLYALTGFEEIVLYAFLLLIFAHGLSKSLLFMNAGTMEILANTREIYDLGYLARIDRRGAFTIVFGGLSLLGAPPTIGFIAKFLGFAAALFAVIRYGVIGVPLLVSLAFMSAAGIVYVLKYLGSYYGGYKPFIGRVIKYYLLDWGEILSVILIIVLGIVGSYMVYVLLSSIYVLILDIILLLALLITQLNIKRIKIREEEPWIGGAYP